MVNTNSIRLVLSSLLFAAVALFASAPAHAQYGKVSNLGITAGYGAGNGPASDQGDYTQGTLDTATTPLGIVFMLGSDSEKDGLGFGGFFSGTLGGSMVKWKRSNIGPGNSAQDGNWYDDFDLNGDMRLGLSLNYRIAKSELLFKIRYFNWYSAVGLRGFYSNNDDPAALGVGAAWKRFGLDVDYGSDKIPGLLVDSTAWNVLRIEARYRIGLWDDGQMTWIGGLRYEGGFLQPAATASGTSGTTVNMVLAFISMGFT